MEAGLKALYIGYERSSKCNPHNLDVKAFNDIALILNINRSFKISSFHKVILS